MQAVPQQVSRQQMCERRPICGCVRKPFECPMDVDATLRSVVDTDADADMPRRIRKLHVRNECQ